MKLYRFSPIKSESELMEAIKYLHIECHKLCKNTFGKYLSVPGNVGVFCHYDDEFVFLKNIQKNLCKPSDNPDQKYFELINPIIMASENDIPETIYTHLYIRKPDPYRSQVGDVDFYIGEEEYLDLKKKIEGGEKLKDARIFPRGDFDMIELFNPDSDVLGYVATSTINEKVRIKVSDFTKL